MKYLMVLIVSLSLMGCLSTSVLRVVDVQGGLRAVTGASCSVHQKGKEESFANVTIYYSNEACTVEVNSVQNTP